MYKFIVFIFFLLLGINTTRSESLIKGGVSYTVPQAREISFKNIDYTVPVESLKKYRKYNRLFGLFKEITVFANNNFSIFDKKKRKVFYYSQEGNLILIEIILDNHKTVRYDINGKLDSVVLDTGNNEQFVFDANKKLVAHWIGKNGYDENGELFNTRN